MSSNISKDNIYKLSAIEIYKKVIQKDLKKFPNGFWQRPEAEQNAINVMKYWIENILIWSDTDIINNLNTTMFGKHHLGAMLQQVFDGNLYEAINKAYPDRFELKDFKSVHKNYWHKEKVNNDIISSVEIYNLIKGKKMGRFPNKYWSSDFSKDQASLLLKYLINIELLKHNEKLTAEFLKKTLLVKFFRENGLIVMFKEVFNNDLFELVNTVYPNKFKIWEICDCHGDFWTKGRKIDAVKWLIEDKLKWSCEEVIDNLKSSTFIENNLSGIMDIYFNLDHLIKQAYPNEYLNCTFK